MGSKPREQSTADIYHVITRGVNKRIIFEDDKDRNCYLKYLSEELGNSGGAVYAWCLMSNHVHLLVHMEIGTLSKFMQALNFRYAVYFNTRHGRVGHLFQQRFKSEPVNDDSYFMTVFRYIHQNPVKAFMCRDCRFPWSSFGEYLGGSRLCDTEFALGLFGGIESLLDFHSTIAYEDRCLEVPLQMSDEEALQFAERVVGAETLAMLCELGKEERDARLRTLKNCMIPVVQLARITPFSKATIVRA